MAAQSNIDPNEGSLLVFGPESGAAYPTEQYLAAQAAASAEGAVDLLYRNLELQHTIRLFKPVIDADRVDRILHAPEHHTASLRTYSSEGLPVVAANARDKHLRLRQEARQHFARAYGLSAMVSLGTIEPSVAKSWARTSYAKLRRQFEKPGDVIEKKRNDFLLDLVREEIILVTHQKSGEILPKPKKPEARQLTDREKLIALRDDPLVGFLPASNAEKTHALTLRDYVNNPDHPQAAIDQLIEVFIHQKKEHPVEGTKLGLEALRSLPLVFGDYLINAVQSISNLRTLKLVVRECLNPRITLHEELGELGETPGVIELIRFMEQRTFRETGKRPADVRFSMFRSHENRDPENHDEFYHKTVEDAYTRTTREKVVEDHLNKKIRVLTIGAIRSVIPEALADQYPRAVFWEARTQEMRKLVKTWRSGHAVLETIQSMAS